MPPRFRRLTLAVLTTLLASASVALAGGQAPPASTDGTAAVAVQDADVLTRVTLSDDERLLALSTLWSEAKFSFAYYDEIAPRWNALYEAFVPRVLGATSDYEYYLALMRFYAHLRDGHSGVFWPRELNQALGYPPLEIRRIEGRPVIFRLLEETEELARLGVRPGLAIVRVDGRPVEERVAYWRELKTGSTEQATNRLAYFRVLTGPRDSTVEVVLEEPGGRSRTVQLTRSHPYFNDTNLTPPRVYSSRAPEVGVGYFRADQMAGEVADAFDEYIENAEGMSGLILDLRYNGGGSDRVSFRMVGRLIEEPLDGPIYEITSYRADRRAFRREQEVIRESAGEIAPAPGKRFTGPLIVLIDEQTHSATESGFLGVIRQRPDTVFAGAPTAGSTGQPLVFRLPGGGLGAVCSRRTLRPDGRSFVGTGFEPDVPIQLTQEDLFRGRDSVLEWALAELRTPAGTGSGESGQR